MKIKDYFNIIFLRRIGRRRKDGVYTHMYTNEEALEAQIFFLQLSVIMLAIACLLNAIASYVRE